MHDPIGIPACFSSGEKQIDDQPSAVIKSGQSVCISVYRTKIADLCRSISIKWCKNLLVHGFSISIEGSQLEDQYNCKVELKPWNFWKKQGCKRITVDGKSVDIYWDLRDARFNGEIEPNSHYYVSVVCDQESVLLIGDLQKEAYRKTGCRPALIDPILVSRTEHIFGKTKFSTRVKFNDKEKGKHHEITIECKNGVDNEPEMEIKIDGYSVIDVKHLQWKFRGNDTIYVKNEEKVQVYWDIHDWLFSTGLRQALFIFKPVMSSKAGIPLPLALPECESCCSSEFSLFLYAWKDE